MAQSYHVPYPHLLAPPQSRHPSSSSVSHRHASSSSHHSIHKDTQTAASESTTSLGFGAKIRNALDLQKYANFDIKLTIHEVSNVPQMQGEFQCNWRFRGKHPKSRDGGVGESVVPLFYVVVSLVSLPSSPTLDPEWRPIQKSKADYQRLINLVFPISESHKPILGIKNPPRRYPSGPLLTINHLPVRVRVKQ